MIGICRLCGQNKKLIKSHIIPKAITKIILYSKHPKKDGARVLVKDELNNINYPKIPTDGYYDPNILCEICDNENLGRLDEYAAEFFKTDFSKFRRDHKGIFYYYDFPADCKTIKLFAISVLWRASISSNPFFSEVNLGPFEDRAKQLIKSNGSPDLSDFEVRLSHYHDISDVNNINSMIRPFQRAKINLSGSQINFYVITLGRIEIGIKVDSQKLFKESQVLFLKEGHNFMLEKSYESRKGRIAITDATEQAIALSRFL